MQDIVFEISKHIHKPPLKILLKLLGTKLYNYVKIIEFNKPYSKYLTNKRIKLFSDLLTLDISYYPEDMNLDYSNEYYTTLTELPTQLRVLNIEGNQRITDENIWYLPLKTLICNNNITDDAVKHLAQLEVLNCSMNRNISDEGIKDMNLTKLIIINNTNNITGRYIKNMTKLNKLKYISNSITNNDIKDMKLKDLSAPGHINDNGIRTMKLHQLYGTNISNELLSKLNLNSLNLIKSFLNQTNYESININHMNLHKLTLNNIDIDITKFKLHVLSLNSTNINDDMIKNMDLKYISINNTCSITDEAFKNMKPFVIKTGGMNDIDGKYINRDNLERIVLSKPCISYTGNKNIRKMKFVSAYDNGSLF